MSNFPVIKHESRIKSRQKKITTEMTFFTSAHRFRHLRHLKIRTELSSAFANVLCLGNEAGSVKFRVTIFT